LELGLKNKRSYPEWYESESFITGMIQWTTSMILKRYWETWRLGPDVDYGTVQDEQQEIKVRFLQNRFATRQSNLTQSIKKIAKEKS
jgi:hypothetical protein